MVNTATTSNQPMKRVSRACLFCRQRKSKCDLDVSQGMPPCGRCLKDNRECVLGGSNRGGSRIRKKKTPSASLGDGAAFRATESVASSRRSESKQEELPVFDPQSMTQPHGGSANSNPTSQPAGMDAQDEVEEVSSRDSPIGNAMPTNPSDAWQLLKDVAVSNTDEEAGKTSDQEAHLRSAMPASNGQASKVRGIYSYRPVREGHLSPEIISGLVNDFKENYHDFLPLVPRKYYEPNMLDQFAIDNKHLLTAILTIASKDIPENRKYIHECCSRYMHDLIASIAAGTDCDVEAVEALLLLAEWVPHGLRKSGEAVGRGEEDRTAWMHVGMALRTGYYLGLDRTSFRGEDTDEVKSLSRKRLAWTCCYISDRLISCRIGKGFWSRGPGPMTGLSTNDFPSLQPTTPGDENHARIFKAILDLTQIYSNVHDILYTATRTNGQMILMGDYVKYIDEFRSTISRWYRQWGSMVCSPHIKVTLDLSYHYLQLYTNAFAFQAAISQALAKREKGDAHHARDHLRKLFKDIGAIPDARFIFSSIEAAKQYLSIFNTHVDAITLRHMPIRFYLYCIYSAVFLYKARSFGALRTTEESLVWDMMIASVNKLKQSSVTSQDAGARYARLLDLLWQKPRPSATVDDLRHHQLSPSSVPTPLSARQSDTSSNGPYGVSPANGFSWLDLGAAADYVSADQYADTRMMGNGAIGSNDLSMGFSFLPQPTHGIDFAGQQLGWFNNGNLPF